MLDGQPGNTIVISFEVSFSIAMASRKILILGAGELGIAITDALLTHVAYDAASTAVTVAIRHSTLASLDTDSSSRMDSLKAYRSRGVAFSSTDLVADSERCISDLFRQHTCVIHAGAMTLPEGTQLKVTRAALAAGVEEYVPWQWGVDYDIIGRQGGLSLFSEQCDVRELLRSQSRTKWFIVSCGVFMSFLFEDFWGVIVRDSESKIIGVRALGGWDHLITATTVEDIARCNAELVLVDIDKRDKAVYIAGDTMRYDEFAEVIERVVGHEVTKELWSTEELSKKSKEEPGEKLFKYRLVFSEGRGLAWEKKGTFNGVKSIEMEGIEAYMRRLGMT